MDLLQSLKNIGFTQQEATIYMTLCKNSMITGYEAAKLSGISRSNAYAALSSLVDKGYAHLIEGNASKYMAVPKDELIKNATRSFNETIETIEEQLIFDEIENQPYVTILGKDPIIQKLCNIISSAKKRIYISCGTEVLDLVTHDLDNICNDGLKVVLITPSDMPTNCTHTHYKCAETSSYKVIIDTSEVMAGTLTQSLYSKNGTLVSLIRESFINEIHVLEEH